MPVFTDDNDKKVEAVTTEQHALDNVGHVVVTFVSIVEGGFALLELKCVTCDWWDQQAIPTEGVQ
jgi:hypothetical protein